uniref:Reverse transcriptase zinc-binding domain-containing protein n=1 Tax=Brassica oleracea var. oleracea TaxID=109376 RepID=A0A0D3DE09_BRAOL
MLNGWGLNVDPLCLLCNTAQESRYHLFFECRYSESVWRRIAYRCDLQVLTSWDDIVAQLQDLRTNRDSLRLPLLATQAVIYWLWTERNSRLHRQTFKPPEAIISLIDKQIRNRLQSIRHAIPRASSAMSQLWFLRS